MSQYTPGVSTRSCVWNVGKEVRKMRWKERRGDTGISEKKKKQVLRRIEKQLKGGELSVEEALKKLGGLPKRVELGQYGDLVTPKRDTPILRARR